jgi:prepilin-type N-terminal cleavage/methylation domain-containing protein
MSRRHPRAGMTLLEVIVALTIAGSALASGAAVLGFLTDQQARAGTQAVVSASAVRGAIRHWISEARLATEGDAEFRGRPGESDELTFVTSAPTDVSASGTIVRLYVASADSATGRGLMAELRPWRHAGAPVTVSLVPDATALHVRYLSSTSGRRSWLDSWVTTSVLPAALELRIEYGGATSRGDERASRALLAEPVVVALAGRQ